MDQPPASANASAPTLLSLDEAVARMLSRVVADAAGARTRRSRPSTRSGDACAADVRSLVDVPPLDNSAMDGYAMRVADVPGAGTVAAGESADPRRRRRSAARDGHGGAHLHRRAGARRRRRDRHAGAMQRRSGTACASTPCRSARPVHPPPRRRRASRNVVLRAGLRLSPQALGMAASVGSGHARRSRAARASPCSRPATSSPCRARRSSPGRSTTRTGSPCAA